MEYQSLSELVEATLHDLAQKQNTEVTKLWPEFWSRVEAVRAAGGIRLITMDQRGWKFICRSVTQYEKNGKPMWYEVRLNFDGVKEVISHYAKDFSLWKKDKSAMNAKKLADAVLQNIDIKVGCACPADLYFGQKFIRSQMPISANVPPPEDRSPDVRNPQQLASYCKHIQVVLSLLPLYSGTFSKWLKQFYANELGSLERDARKEGNAEKDRAEEVQKKEEDGVSNKEAANKSEEGESWEEGEKENPGRIGESRIDEKEHTYYSPRHKGAKVRTNDGLEWTIIGNHYAGENWNLFDLYDDGRDEKRYGVKKEELTLVESKINEDIERKEVESLYPDVKWDDGDVMPYNTMAFVCTKSKAYWINEPYVDLGESLHDKIIKKYGLREIGIHGIEIIHGYYCPPDSWRGNDSDYDWSIKIAGDLFPDDFNLDKIKKQVHSVFSEWWQAAHKKFIFME